MIKQTILVNSDLGMGKGKIAGQVAHGEVYYMDMIFELKIDGYLEWSNGLEDYEEKRINNYDEWVKDRLMPKIVLKVGEDEMIELSEKLKEQEVWSKVVKDCGFTQIEKNARTCCCFEPLDEEINNKWFGHLKLL